MFESFILKYNLQQSTERDELEWSWKYKRAT